MLAGLVSHVNSLYIHVPFCSHKCEYCAFYSAPGDAPIIARYLGALERELELVAPELKPRTIFFGGGTPSLLSLKQWERIFDKLQALGLSGAQEFTIECNPATVSPDKARLWKERGVNRASFGVQSFSPAMLQRLGRIHTREMAFETFEILRRSGFDNINLDLMFAIPGQSRELWRETLREALALGSEHLSCYELTYEEDTPFFERLGAGLYQEDEDLACAMYDELLEQAERHGLHRYEISNFARDKKAPDGKTPWAAPFWACQHNLSYWKSDDYYGLGPSAASYVSGVRSKNWSNTELYCEWLEQGKRAVESQEKLPPLRRAGEIAAFGLRMTAGWPLAEFKKQTGYELGAEWKAEVEKLVESGWGRLDSERFCLTPVGLRFADAAAAMFLR